MLAWLRKNVNTQYHPCSSCRMGDDDLAVVDAEGRVHGATGLRVIDAAIIPRITNANLHCPTMMIAEKLSDVLLGTPPLPAEPQPYA